MAIERPRFGVGRERSENRVGNLRQFPPGILLGVHVQGGHGSGRQLHEPLDVGRCLVVYVVPPGPEGIEPPAGHNRRIFVDCYLAAHGGFVQFVPLGGIVALDPYRLHNLGDCLCSLGLAPGPG